MVWGLGFQVWGLGFRIEGVGVGLRCKQHAPLVTLNPRFVFSAEDFGDECFGFGA